MIRLTDPTRIGPALAEIRRSRGATQTAVAYAVGMWNTQYGHYEHGDKLPGLPNLIRLARALGYDLALVPREEPEEVAPDLEPAPSAETIASVLAIVDAPYRPGLDARFEEDA